MVSLGKTIRFAVQYVWFWKALNDSFVSCCLSSVYDMLMKKL